MKRQLLSGAAATALVVSSAIFSQGVLAQEATGQGPVRAMGGDINPFGGDINPFGGDINPFGGDINPFGGDINPFGGDINPFGGDINPFGGDINPFGGDINPFGGDINPFGGDINPFGGDINPFGGDINPFQASQSPFYGFVSPFWGNVEPYWGDINPFGGDINPFGGDINPFGGDINPFGGDINPFGGDINPFWGDLSTVGGDINPFGGDINPFGGDINPFWETAGGVWGVMNLGWDQIDPETGDYQPIADGLNLIFDEAENVFGEAIQSATGKSMNEAFLNALLDDFGIDPANPASLASMDAADRSEFFLTFYDNLMSYTGIDHVDHWMAATNWYPALSQMYGGGDRVRIGLMDFSTRSGDGYFQLSQGDFGSRDFHHGAAVRSLINAPLDGSGVMGVAQNADLISFDPYDDTQTTDWGTVELGMSYLALMQTDIVNLSMGVSGWTLAPEWERIFTSPFVRLFGDDTLFVLAAGNDGAAQTVDVDWTGVNTVENLLIVGSVDPGGHISSFSNRPGDACLTVRGSCQPGHRLMDRFLVAPGELILVDDSDGGVVRVSGTSFAAPLVSGAAALVKGHWGWLEGADLADVLLQSATDLGDEGVDAVYGHGLLNVAGAMAPIDAGDLYVVDRRGRQVSASDVMIDGGRLRFRYGSSDTVVLFENVNDTFRDFEISVDALTAGSSLSDNVSSIYAETYIYERTTGSSGASFTDAGLMDRPVLRRGNLEVTAFAGATDLQGRGLSRELGFQTGLRFADRSTGRDVMLGVGEGALALTGNDGFGLFSDHRPETGGVNPVLGFASGGVFAASGFQLSERTRLTVGSTMNHEERTYLIPGTGEERPLHDGLAAYQAMALNVAIEHRLSDTTTLHGAVTQLHETTGLLGAQGTGPLDFSGGADTSAFSMGVDTELTPRLRLSASTTAAVTRQTAFDSGLLDLDDNIVSTAAQMSIQYSGIAGEADAIRVSLMQPLHVETGSLRYTAARVTDRETGALGFDSQVWELGGERPLYTEFLYSTPLPGIMGEASLFARQQVAGNAFDRARNDLAAGASFRMRF
ncbi:S8 family serine peptidase [Maricaulis sp.]|uniref:S8 family serine peptidase n=1 Tax=Maricaulis sp. TaxID=1486257 RepID=UPI00329680E3